MHPSAVGRRHAADLVTNTAPAGGRTAAGQAGPVAGHRHVDHREHVEYARPGARRRRLLAAARLHCGQVRLYRRRNRGGVYVVLAATVTVER